METAKTRKPVFAVQYSKDVNGGLAISDWVEYMVPIRAINRHAALAKFHYTMQNKKGGCCPYLILDCWKA